MCHTGRLYAVWSRYCENHNLFLRVQSERMQSQDRVRSWPRGRQILSGRTCLSPPGVELGSFKNMNINYGIMQYSPDQLNRKIKIDFSLSNRFKLFWRQID